MKKILALKTAILLTFATICHAQNSQDIKEGNLEEINQQKNNGTSLIDRFNQVKESIQEVKDDIAKIADAPKALFNENKDSVQKILDNKNTISSSDNKKYKSLMYSDEEVEMIKRAVDSFKSGETLLIDDEGDTILDKEQQDLLAQQQREKELNELNERSKIYLSSILYFSDQNWAIWLNKNKINSDDNKINNEFFVEEISGRKAKIIWTLSLTKWKILSGNNNENTIPEIDENNRIKIRFTLEPNQTFLLRYNSVIEGRDVSQISQN